MGGPGLPSTKEMGPVAKAPERLCSLEEVGEVSQSTHCGHHRVNPNGMFVCIQRSNKMLYLWDFGQHNTTITVNLENHF